MLTPLQEALVLGIVLVNGYCFGANCVERFVNYATWPLVGVDSFKAYHKAQQPLIQTFVVAPVAVGFVLQIWFLWNVPARVSPAVAWVMVIASAVGAVSTVALQLPIHAAFNKDGFSMALMQRLLRTDWIRKAADVVRLGTTVVLLHQVVSAG